MAEQLFPGTDGNLQAILRWRDRTGPHLIVGAIRVISQVEIHKEALTRQRLRLQITACGIRLLTTERIDKRQEISVLILIDCQFGGLSVHLKFESPIPHISLYATG